jgi:outer membrane protein OmpA-like peptidoglycan-associated protein
MGETPKPGNGGEAGPAASDPLVELRGLLLAAEEAQVVKIQERLDDPRSRAEDVGRVLPEAIAIRSGEDRALTDALLPSVEEAIGISVRRHPDVLVDGLFPVMGPAIRKSIVNTLSEMLESLNQTLALGFSRQGLKWRIEAWRTGKPFAQVVLLRTLLYRVEQVFLIHRQTGLLLAQVSAGGAAIEDADMVSGMLTAIRDFVDDSFGSGAGAGGLDAFRVGELTVFVEQAPQALLAAVIRGNPPAELRTVLAEALERIHREQERAFEEFSGDAAAFQRSRDALESCLKSQKHPAQEKAPRARGARRYLPLFVALAVVVGLAGFWIFSTVRRDRRFEDYVRRLTAQPGIVVTSSGRRGGRFFVAGLRDPLASDPAALLGPSKLDPDQVTSTWKPYRALDANLILARARTFLTAPATVTLRLERGVLVASGTAPRRWIEDSRNLARAIPDVSSYDDGGVADTDAKALDAARERLEARRIFFARGSSDLVPAEEAKLGGIAADLRALPGLASAAGRELSIEVVGRGDSEGSSDFNAALSRRRAERVLAALRAATAAAPLTAIGVGSAQPLVEERTEEDKQLNRSVSFRAVVADRRPAGAAR